MLTNKLYILLSRLIFVHCTKYHLAIRFFFFLVTNSLWKIVLLNLRLHFANQCFEFYHHFQCYFVQKLFKSSSLTMSLITTLGNDDEDDARCANTVCSFLIFPSRSAHFLWIAKNKVSCTYYIVLALCKNKTFRRLNYLAVSVPGIL